MDTREFPSKISIMHKNDLMTEVFIDGNRVTVKYHTDDPFLRQIPPVPLDKYKLLDLLEDRCYEREYADIDDVLKAMGLPYYDVLGILRHTHGLLYDDFFWVKFDDEDICYEDIKIRD